MSLLILLAKIIAQFTPDGGMAQTAQGLCFDLADAFTRHAHLASDLFEGVGLTVEQAEIFGLPVDIARLSSHTANVSALRVFVRQTRRRR